MSWDTINGDARILPSSGLGNANEIKMEPGKPVKVRLLCVSDDEPYSYFEHTIEADGTDDKGQKTRIFRTARCTKTSKDPNAYCPLCDGQRFPRRVRNAANVWDYESNSIKKLNAGDSVWKPIATCRKMGVDVMGVDWGLLRTGENRNDTQYTATNLGPSAFVLPADAQPYNIVEEYAPHTVEQMKEIVESCGLTWEFATTPPSLEYPTLEDALAHVMPNGKWKDKTFKEIWEADRSSKGMINYLATRSTRITPEKAAAQVILVNLGGANIPGVPRMGQAAPAAAPQPTASTASPQPVSGPSFAQTAKPVPQPVAQPKANGAAPTATGRQGKIDAINGLLSTKQTFVTGGYKKIMEVMQAASGGKTNIADFSDAELDKLLKMCEDAQ